ncbi:MAG: hypothetical protein FWF03_05895, partial [Defluviitaleaceae bacterium]|nr:hypothetical protein [Defluviitaleaceae bacterium]
MRHVLKSAAVLLVISAIIAALLSAVNLLTSGPIEKQAQKARDLAMAEVLSEADSFEKKEAPLSGSITGIYEGFA